MANCEKFKIVFKVCFSSNAIHDIEVDKNDGK